MFAPITRRRFLDATTYGMGTTALAWLLFREGAFGADVSKPPTEPKIYDLKPHAGHFQAKAKAMIALCMQGGPSHVDLFDPKPELKKIDGKPLPNPSQFPDIPPTRNVMACPWKFEKHGQCGTEVSELLPHIASIVDDITVVRSMRTGVNGHSPMTRRFNTGRTVEGHPALGSWLCYGLGSEAQNLPAFVALPGGNNKVMDGSTNWSNGWLPSIYQGTAARAKEPRILNLDPPAYLKGKPQDDLRAYLDRLNKDHLAAHPGESDLDARIASFELAASMQTAAKEALDLSQESEATKKMYGIDDPVTRDFGTRCLLARRLIERGVRFVQVFSSDPTHAIWDHHGSIQKELPKTCLSHDKPSAALIKDLKQRGLLDSTLVYWGGEMGRMPTVEPSKDNDVSKAGRDHNGQGFTWWFAGGGIKGGGTYGATDDFGYAAVKDIVTPEDFQATVLHLFGLDYKRLTFKLNGREMSLLDGKPCRVVKEIFA